MTVPGWVVLVVLAQAAPAATGEASVESGPAETAKEQESPAPADQGEAAPAQEDHRGDSARPAAPAHVGLAGRAPGTVRVTVVSPHRPTELWHEAWGKEEVVCTGSCGEDLSRNGKYELRFPGIDQSSDAIWLGRFRDRALLEVHGPNGGLKSGGLALIAVGGAAGVFGVGTFLVLSFWIVGAAFAGLGCAFGGRGCATTADAERAWSVMWLPALIGLGAGVVMVPPGVLMFVNGRRVHVDVSGT